jgi:hypothetical protein
LVDTIFVDSIFLVHETGGVIYIVHATNVAQQRFDVVVNVCGGNPSGRTNFLS